MLILLTIFLFIFISLVMLILNLVRPKFSIQGFLTVLTALAGWAMVFLARVGSPQVITLLQWKPEYLFPLSPAMLIDNYSWYFALAIVSLSVTVLITSITQLGYGSKSNDSATYNLNPDNNSQNHLLSGSSTSASVTSDRTNMKPNWRSWAAILVISSLGLVAVTSGNLLTLLLAWAALDIVELFILLGWVPQSVLRERIILSFSAKVAGIGILLFTAIMLWSQGASLSFNTISPSTSLLLVLAAGMRLGVLPLNLPLTHRLPITRGTETILPLVSAAAGFILLIRVSHVGVAGVITPYILGITTIVGMFAALNWFITKEELEGKRYWLLGTASLAIAALIVNQPTACLVWGISSLLSGGFIFSMSLHHRNLLPIVVLGLINFSALPLSPSWQLTTLYAFSANTQINPILFSIIGFLLLLTQVFLFAGFTRLALRGSFSAIIQKPENIERWVWFLYPIGLFFIVLTHFLIGLQLYPDMKTAPVFIWIVGPIIVALCGLFLYVGERFPQTFHIMGRSKMASFGKDLLSLNWFYRFLWKVFHIVARIFALLSDILEGEGGIIWALVLFALIFVFLQR